MGKNPAEKSKDAANKKAAELRTKPKAEKTPKKPKVVASAVDKGVAVAKACKISSCKRAYRAKGYCKAHYRKWRHGEYGDTRHKICNDKSGCKKPMARSRHGFCEEHYQAYYIKGVVAAKPAPAAAPAKTEEKPAAAAS